MAAPPNTGMTRGEMRKMLLRSFGEGMGCAIGLSDDTKTALFMMHRMRRGKAMEKMLKDEFPDAKSLRFGTAFVHEDEPKKVHLALNRAAPGIARKLIKTLKGTGFTKVVIASEDGLTEEVEEEDDTPVEGEAAPAAPQGEAPVAAAPPPPPPPPGEEAPVPPPPPGGPPEMGATQADKDKRAADLTRELATLIPLIGPASVGDEALKAKLGKLAKDCNLNIKTGNLEYGTMYVAALRKALEQAGAAPGAPEAPATAELEPIRVRWAGIRKEIEGEVGSLRKALADAYAGQDVGAEIQKRFDAKASPMLARLDGKLETALSAVVAAKDAADRDGRITEAKAVLQEFTGFATGDAFITDLDSNPFLPLSIRAKATAALGEVGKALA